MKPKQIVNRPNQNKRKQISRFVLLGAIYLTIIPRARVGYEMVEARSAELAISIFHYIHTEIYTLKSRSVNFRSQADVNQSNVAYCFSHMWEKRYVQSRAAYHVFSRVSRTASWSFHQGWLGWFRFVSFHLLFKAKVISLKEKGGGKEFELWSQTPTKQPWNQGSQLYFIRFGFYLSSFAFQLISGASSKNNC